MSPLFTGEASPSVPSNSQSGLSSGGSVEAGGISAVFALFSVLFNAVFGMSRGLLSVGITGLSAGLAGSAYPASAGAALLG